MIKIRSNVFETNSSSTHSLSIYHKENNKFTGGLIPQNSIIPITYCDSLCDCEIRSPMEKLMELIQYIGNYYSDCEIHYK